MPFREIPSVRHDPGESNRRWFIGDDLELIIWSDEAGGVRRFQLAYDRRGEERMVEWDRSRGIALHRVDTGEVHPLQPKATPILAPDHRRPPGDLAARFAAAAGSLERRVRDSVEVVLRKLGTGEPRA